MQNTSPRFAWQQQRGPSTSPRKPHPHFRPTDGHGIVASGSNLGPCDFQAESNFQGRRSHSRVHLWIPSCIFHTGHTRRNHKQGSEAQLVCASTPGIRWRRIWRPLPGKKSGETFRRTLMDAQTFENEKKTTKFTLDAGQAYFFYQAILYHKDYGHLRLPHFVILNVNDRARLPPLPVLDGRATRPLTPKPRKPPGPNVWFRLESYTKQEVWCSSCMMWGLDAGDDSWWHCVSDEPHGENGKYFRLQEKKEPHKYFCSSIMMWGEDAGIDSWWTMEYGSGEWFRLREKGESQNYFCSSGMMWGSNAGDDSWWRIRYDWA